MNNNFVFRRIGAYLIDILVIAIISAGIVELSFLNPKFEAYKEVSNQYNETLSDYYNKEIDIDKFSEKSKELGYEMNKNGQVYIISGIILSLIYYGGFVYWTKGQTLGKNLFKLKIVHKDSTKNLKFYNYLIRTIILNGLILNILTLIALQFSKNTYFEIYNIISNLDTIIIMIIFLMVMFSKDGRGLHDILAMTKVIDLKAKPALESKIIKPKKEEHNDE